MSERTSYFLVKAKLDEAIDVLAKARIEARVEPHGAWLVVGHPMLALTKLARCFPLCALVQLDEGDAAPTLQFALDGAVITSKRSHARLARALGVSEAKVAAALASSAKQFWNRVAALGLPCVPLYDQRELPPARRKSGAKARMKLRRVETSGYFTDGVRVVYRDSDGDIALTGVHASRLQILAYDCAKDGDHVFLGGEPIEGADAATFELLKTTSSNTPYMRDRRRVYAWGKPLAGVDPKAFEVAGEYGWDAHHAWYGGQRMDGADGATFHVFPNAVLFARDKRSVYYAGAVLADADPESFRPLNVQYAVDRTNAFYADSKIEGADVETLHASQTYTEASDRNHRYAFGRRVEARAKGSRRREAAR